MSTRNQVQQWRPARRMTEEVMETVVVVPCPKKMSSPLFRRNFDRDLYQETDSGMNGPGPSQEDMNPESVFLTLGRLAFPRIEESLLPKLTLQTIYNRTKYLVQRWTDSPLHSLTVDEKQFLDSFCLKGWDSVEISEWQCLRDIFSAGLSVVMESNGVLSALNCQLDDEVWRVDLEQYLDSGIDDSQLDTSGASIFQGQLQFDCFSLSDLLLEYPDPTQVTFDNGLTIVEEFAFMDLAGQLKTFYSLKPRGQRIYDLGKKPVGPTGIPVSVSSSKTLSRKSSSLPTRRSTRLATNKTLTVCDEHDCPPPTPEFLLKHAGMFIRDSEFTIPYDLDTTPAEPLLPVESSECPKDFCLLGCVCESIQGSGIVRDHCGKPECQLECICKLASEKEDGKMRLRSRNRPLATKAKKRSVRGVPAKKNRKRGNSAIDIPDLLPMKRGAFSSDTIKSSTTTKMSDSGHSSLGDTDMTETSSDDGAGSPRPVELVTISDDEDGEFEGEESMVTEQAGKGQQVQKSYQSCPVGTVEANLDLPIDQIETLCAPGLLYARERKVVKKNRRGLYMASPVEIVEDEEENRTICILTGPECHQVIVNWSVDCQIPMASKTVIPVDSLIMDTVITLPVPPIGETFFLFEIPSKMDGEEGDMLFHVHDLQLQLPLERLRSTRKYTRTQVTHRFKLNGTDGKWYRSPAGHPCHIYLFSSLPSILVLGPFPSTPPRCTSPLPPSVAKSVKPKSKTRKPKTVPRRKRTSSSNNGQSETDWNGDGEYFPMDYYENFYQHFLLGFPPESRHG